MTPGDRMLRSLLAPAILAFASLSMPQSAASREIASPQDCRWTQGAFTTVIPCTSPAVPEQIIDPVVTGSIAEGGATTFTLSGFVVVTPGMTSQILRLEPLQLPPAD